MDLFFTKIAYAAASTDLNGFIGNVDNLIINPLIKVLFALAVMFFLYGVFEFISNQDNQEKKTTGKSHMLWGIIGITIMMGVFMIMNMLLSTLGISKSQVDIQNGTVNFPSSD